MNRFDLQDIYKNIIKAELRLANLISEIDKEENYSNSPGIKGFANAVQIDDYVKITVDRIPEKIALHKEVVTDYYGYIKDFWIGAIINAIAEADIKLKFDKCVVLIKINYKEKEWDPDNHHINFIINAIRYSGLIPDDNYKCLSYMVMGAASPTDKYNTEIYVCSEKTFLSLYNRLNKI